LHVALVSGFLLTKPFIISSIPDTRPTPFAAHCREGRKCSFVLDPGRTRVNSDRRTGRWERNQEPTPLGRIRV